MTYLPDLKAALVEAARQRSADVQESQQQDARRRRLHAGGLATALAAAVAVAIAVVAIVALGNRRGSTGSASNTAPTRSELRQSAGQLLGEIVLPPGAVMSGLVPGTPAELWSASSGMAIPNHVDVYRVWRLPETPDRVIAFIQKHQPPGSMIGMGSEETSSSAYVNGAGGSRKSITYSATTVIDFPSTSVGIWRRLALDAVTLRRGGTALRVDSQAGWLPPRPAGERIPSGVARIALTATGTRRGQHESVVITSPRRVQAFVSAFNSLPTAWAGISRCKARPAGSITLAFDGPAQTTPLAQAVWTFPCHAIQLAIGGRPQVPLAVGLPDSPITDQFLQLVAFSLPPRRVASSAATLNSSQRCTSNTSSTPASSQSAHGAAGGSCTSESRSTTSGSSR